MPVIDNQGVAIAYEEAGVGLPVVLIHSFLGSGKIWRAQVPVLAEQHRVINVDVRGHGRSGHLTEPFTLYDAVDDVIAVLDALGIERAVWCGLSIGGMVALRGAIRYPQRVAGLILMDTDAGAETAWHRVKYRAMGIAVSVLGFRPLLPFITRLMFGATTRRDNPALVSEARVMIARNHVPSALRCLEALMRRDSVVERLHEIDVPALVVVGKEDRMLPPPLSRRIQEGLVDASLTTISGAGHMTPLEQPERVNAAVLAFLATLAYPPPSGIAAPPCGTGLAPLSHPIHQALLERNGRYASLWRRQSGGFIGVEVDDASDGHWVAEADQRDAASCRSRLSAGACSRSCMP